jgi:transcription-repair coupling factor (superfamily II helicase)
LHNRIETIGAAEQRIKRIMQRAHHLYDRKDGVLYPGKTSHPAIGMIHGRMKEKELIRIMDAFRNKEINILLATTIIENGLDISSANTLIVDDATRLGLAQAHQLRGRIGRGTEQAFAYFLYRPHRLTEKAAARLDALKEYADLDAGYDIALRDLEIRGAGNVLGREQSGSINKVGLNLYCQMLAEAVEKTAHLPK